MIQLRLIEYGKKLKGPGLKALDIKICSFSGLKPPAPSAGPVEV
jgi:hypothetical protein